LARSRSTTSSHILSRRHLQEREARLQLLQLCDWNGLPIKRGRRFCVGTAAVGQRTIRSPFLNLVEHVDHAWPDPDKVSSPSNIRAENVPQKFGGGSELTDQRLVQQVGSQHLITRLGLTQ